ncbi:phage holin [Clostridiales Family XIII bacterium ASD5510]|uniref:Phage holin n=1 Tax=Hominibacterium faecale TaxID=2839743 RepID=A0A9J6QQZ8_9FIRM|nr:phage holin [Hominibacterium faecale]MCU7379728.1 phage holin [Hominibacterium faecale]
MKNLIIRTAVLVILWVNMILAHKGLSPLPIDEAGATELTSDILAAAATLWAWWKNNNVTKAARAGQLVTDEIKSENVVGNCEVDFTEDDLLDDIEQE